MASPIAKRVLSRNHEITQFLSQRQSFLLMASIVTHRIHEIKDASNAYHRDTKLVATANDAIKFVKMVTNYQFIDPDRFVQFVRMYANTIVQLDVYGPTSISNYKGVMEMIRDMDERTLCKFVLLNIPSTVHTNIQRVVIPGLRNTCSSDVTFRFTPKRR